MHRVACTLCAGLLAAGFAAAAHANPITYTWVTQSSVPPDDAATAPPLSLSFTVDGPVSVSANDEFANSGTGNFPPEMQETYPFPHALTAFDLNIPTVTEFAITLANFVSPKETLGDGEGYIGYPRWSIDLTADPAAGTASLSLFFLNNFDSDEVYGAPIASSNPFQISTGAPGTIYYGSDPYPTREPAQYTGMLVATDPPDPVPEPNSLLLLSAGLGIMAIGVGRRGPRSTFR